MIQELNEKSVAVYCKTGCGRIIFATSMENYSNGHKKIVDAYFEHGHQTGLVDDEMVRSNYRCRCEKPTK